jgi:hypothetical protein
MPSGVATPVLVFLMGNSSSMGFGIGMGPDILPRMDWPAGLGRPALEADFHRLTFMMPVYGEAVRGRRGREDGERWWLIW